MKKRFLALFMTFVMMFTLIPVDAFATDAVDTPSGVVVEATQEEVPENTETETPVVEEPVLDPVQQLYDALMACATYEELDAYMEAMSEEDYALMAQFTDEQNAALTAKIQQLQENDVELLANRSFRFYWSDEVKADVASIDIISGGNTYNVPNSTNSGTYNVDDRDIQVRINYASGADDTYRAYVSWDMWDGRYEVEFSRNTVIFQHLDIKIESEAPITIKHKTVNMITGAVVGEETRTIAADIDAVHSITFAGVTYDDFEDAPGGDTDTRIDGLRIKLPTINESTTATIILDLRDEEGTLYEDVVINYNYAGIQEAMRSCDSWGQNTGGYGYGIDFVPANGSSNTYTIEYTQYVIPVEKIWDDNNNQDGIRPDSVTIALYANGTQVDTIALNAESEWKGQFENKPSHTDAGAVITYTIDEISVPAGYTKTGVGNNGTYLTVTNAHTPEEITIRGTKTWEDNNNQDGIRPDSITVNLLANGTVVDTAEAKASEGWTYEFTAPKYAAGREIAYSVSEETVEGYKPTVNGYDITNSHTPATTEATIVKVWDDAENQDGKRPAELKVTLSNGTVVTLNEANGWEATVKDLPKYAAGNEIAYTWTEAEVGGYKLTDNKTEGTVTTLTNTHEVEKTSVTVTKVWNDNNNQDGKRPASITINLLANGVVAQTATVTAENGWEYTFENLDKFAAGEEIVYTVTEDKVSDYTTAVDGFTVTNTHTPETVEVSGTKTWVDADDQDGKRPASITINLLANGKEVKSVEVTEKTNWEFKFTDLPKYEAGTEIVYTITEEAVDGYTTEIKDFDVTNTHTPEETEVTVTKVWDDNNNQDGIRPANVTVRLYADGTEVGSATLAGEWTYTFENLDKYAKGKEIVYTVSEDAVTGYEATVDGFTITNKHTPETIEISGGKTWDDADNQDGIRPETITINLLADGEVIDSVDVKDGKWSFTNLPKFKDGVEIVYTITEEPVEGYETTVDGFNVTNTHEVETTEVTVNKVWDDADNQDGIRPESITVNLLANGEVVKTAAVTAEEEWTYTFTDL
ncbi:MAG: Cna B-type domain-containing protein, partial [Oscillospiraceae bacterium]|nr:Cna B-type domain-containing protein [Oscillospiraceae bacterium]